MRFGCGGRGQEKREEAHSDHVGAKVGQNLPAERCRGEPCELEDSDAGQRRP